MSKLPLLPTSTTSLSDTIRILSLFILIVLSGIFAGAIAWLSPNPLPMAHTQLLTACIALFSASGYALVRMLHPTERKKPVLPVEESEGHHAPTLEGPDAEILPPAQATKRRNATQSQWPAS